MLVIYTLLSILIIQADLFFPYTLTHYLVSFTTLSEYLLFALFLYFNLKSNKVKNSLLVLTVFYVIFSFFYAFTVKIRTIDTIPIGIETIIILSFSFYFLYERMNEPTTDLIYNDYRFWIILGMMIYLAGSFFIYIFSDQVDRELFNKYLSLTYIFYALKNILFALGIWIHAKREPQRVKHQKDSLPYLDIN